MIYDERLHNNFNFYFDIKCPLLEHQTIYNFMISVQNTKHNTC